MHLGVPQVATSAALQLRSIVEPSWTVTASTIQHIPRENDATVQEALQHSNIIVCMGKHTFDELEKRFDFDARKMLVWDIDKHPSKSLAAKCQELMAYLNEGSWVDVTDKEGNRSGVVMPASWVCDRGYWHRGVHVILMTKQGGAVLEMRAKDMPSNPGMVDITLGGFVDAGEEPAHAALRELKEELGIILGEDQLYLLDTRLRTSWHPRHSKLSRSIMYTYVGFIDETEMAFRPEFSEVRGVALCTPKQLGDLLRGKHIQHIGRISSSLKFYNDIVRLARRQLKTLHAPRRKRKKTVQ